MCRSVHQDGHVLNDIVQDRRKLKPVRIWQSRYWDNRIEQDHCEIKRPIQPMLASSPLSVRV